MTAKETNKLIWTITLCTAVLIWGTLWVYRQVNDVNYHAPTTLDTYNKCASVIGAKSEDCRKIIQNAN